MFAKLTSYFNQLLVAGGPSMSRLIMFIITFIGGALLCYGVRQGDINWPWTVCFLGYLAYGLGPHTLGKYFYTLRVIKGSKEDDKEEDK